MPEMAFGIRQRKPEVDVRTPKQVESDAILSTKNHHVCRARLKRSASTSTILCAFAMASLSELQINLPTKCPGWLFTLFGVCTTTLIGIHITALVISNFVLPNIEYLGHRRFAHSTMAMIEEYPNNEYARRHIELAWTFSTVVGMFLFLIQVVLLCWVKFYDFYISACVAGTIVVLPFMALFIIFCLYFHRELLNHSYKLRIQDLKDIEDMKDELELISVKVTK